MRKIIVLLLVISAVLLTSCLSVDVDKVYEQEKLAMVKSWNLAFQYDNITIEEKSGTDEKKVTEGQSKNDVKFFNDLYYALKDSGQIKIAKSGNEANILINITRKYGDSDLGMTCDVLFTDKEGLELGRMSFLSKNVHLLHKGQNEFVKYVADQLIDKLSESSAL
ncbi:hypothetical protein [Spirochaeta cellobiosiphila]|uniref:hypothetical protein n=1 Tax=Spirochaeta cellobiosiphila TaxID=504483 RepID=UPI00041FABDA|nr:hypothetical protein [Spirochaeta cellobiosiphila]